MPHETVPADIAAAVKAFEQAVHSDAYCPGGGVDETRAALNVAILRHIRNAADRTEVIVPWAFGAKDCLHKSGFEAECQCIGCPRQSRDAAPTDTGGVTHRIAGA